MAHADTYGQNAHGWDFRCPKKSENLSQTPRGRVMNETSCHETELVICFRIPVLSSQSVHFNTRRLST